MDKEQYFGRLFAIAINHECTHNISSLENIRVKLKKKNKKKTVKVLCKWNKVSNKSFQRP